MRKIDHLATEIYTFTDDALKRQPHLAHWRRSNNRSPLFTDAEGLTIALLQPALGLISLKDAYELVRDNLRDAFPCLPCYAQWLARLHKLGTLTGHLMQVAAKQARSEEPDRPEPMTRVTLKHIKLSPWMGGVPRRGEGVDQRHPFIQR